MSSSDSKNQEAVTRASHPAATTEQLLAALPPHSLRDLVDQTYLLPMRYSKEGLVVPDLLKAVITPDHIRRLFTLWACLKLSGADELHVWHLTSFKFVSSATEGVQGAAAREIEQAAAEDFSGLHACVFADGDISFYIDHPTSGPAFASSVISLSQFGHLGNC